MSAQWGAGTRLAVLAAILAVLLALGGYVAEPASANAAPHDDIADAAAVGALPFAASLDTLTATRSPSDPVPSCGAPGDYTVWYSYTPAQDATVVISSSGADGFPAVPTVFTGPAGATSSTPLTEVGCSTSGTVNLSVTAGTTYYVMFGSFTPRPTFTVAVAPAEPLTAPTITAPPVSVGTQPGACGALVEYGDLVVSGNPVPTTELSRPSGSFFEVGMSTVHVSAANAVGSTSTSFTVTVIDTESPLLVVPDPIFVDATSPSGAVVEYVLTAIDNCPGVTVSSDPPSGGTFVVGDTVVAGTATDAAGNRKTATFRVHVSGAAEQLAALRGNVTGIGLGRSLDTRLAKAERHLARGDTLAGCHAVAVFVAAVTVQTPRHIDPVISAALVGDAMRIRSALGCPSSPGLSPVRH